MKQTPLSVTCSSFGCVQPASGLPPLTQGLPPVVSPPFTRSARPMMKYPTVRNHCVKGFLFRAVNKSSLCLPVFCLSRLDLLHYHWSIADQMQFVEIYFLNESKGVMPKAPERLMCMCRLPQGKWIVKGGTLYNWEDGCVHMGGGEEPGGRGEQQSGNTWWADVISLFSQRRWPTTSTTGQWYRAPHWITGKQHRVVTKPPTRARDGGGL